MVLYVGPGGSLIDGPLPPGESTKVLALVNGQHREVYVISGGDTPADSSEVTAAALRYDTIEYTPAPDASQALGATVSEYLGQLTEEVVAAMLATAAEDAPVPVELVIVTVSPTAVEQVPTLTDGAAVGAAVGEAVPVPVDQASLIAVPTSEALPTPVTTETVAGTVTAADTLPAPADSARVGAVAADTAPTPADVETLSASMTSYANAVVSNANWTNPSNALGNTTAAATLTASSSGVGGLTSNTVSGTLVLSFADPILDDLTIQSAVLSYEVSQQGSLIAVGGSSTWSIEYSLNGGSTWTVAASGTGAITQATQPYTITTAVGTDWAKVTNLQARVVATEVSGVGSSVTRTFSWFRAFITVVATRSYT